MLLLFIIPEKENPLQVW